MWILILKGAILVPYVLMTCAMPTSTEKLFKETYYEAITSGQLKPMPNISVNCSFQMDTKNEDRSINVLNELHNGVIDLVYVQVLLPEGALNSSITKRFEKSLFGWILVNKHGEKILSYPRDYDVISLGMLKKRARKIKVSMEAFGEDCQSLKFKGIVRSLSIFFKSAIRNVLNNTKLCHRLYESDKRNTRNKYFFVSPPWKQYKMICFSGECSDNMCATIITENWVVFFAYAVAHIIVVFSPLFAYLLLDYFQFNDKMLYFYTETDTPYGFSRFIMAASHALFCPQYCKGFVKNKSFFKVCIIVWVLNLCVYFFNMFAHIQFQSNESSFDNTNKWFKNDSFNTKEVLVQYLLYSVALVIIIITLNLMGGNQITKTTTKPQIYCFSSNGHLKNFYLVKTYLSFFREPYMMLDLDKKSKPENKHANVGRQLFLIQLHRLLLLTSRQFWNHIFRQSFSCFSNRHNGYFWYCVIIIPAFVVSTTFVILSSFLNIIWGLFPLIGLFLTFLSSLSNFRDVVKLFTVTILMYFFIQNIFGENVLFLINTVTYTLFVGVPTDPAASLPLMANILPGLIYCLYYWTQFSSRYKEILHLIFEMRKEVVPSENGFKMHQETPSDDASLEGNSKTNIKENSDIAVCSENRIDVPADSIHVEEFSFICNYSEPANGQIMSLVTRLLLTLMFLIFTISILFMEGKKGGLHLFSKIVVLCFIIATPGGLQKLLKNDDHSRKEKLRQQIMNGITEWRRLKLSESKEHKTFEAPLEVTEVKCMCCYCCCTKVPDSAESNDQMVFEETGSVTMNIDYE